MTLSLKSLIRLRLFVLMFFSMLVSACGFTPLHAPGGANFQTVRVDLAPAIVVGDKEAAFWVQQRLAERFGGAATAKQVLEITPRAYRSGLGISGQDIATRYDLNMSIRYKLTEASTGKVLDRGTVNGVSTFTATGDPYALVTAEKETTQQLAVDTADRLLTKLAGYYARTRK
jgi:LPS-assembly lipoprotein